MHSFISQRLSAAMATSVRNGLWTARM